MTSEEQEPKLRIGPFKCGLSLSRSVARATSARFNLSLFTRHGFFLVGGIRLERMTFCL